MRLKRRYLIFISALAIVSNTFGSDSAHRYVSCGIHFRGPDRQIDLQGLGDLPVELQELVARHISDRIGSVYTPGLILDRVQLIDLDARRRYNLLYQFRLSPEVSLSTCIYLEPNGNIVQGLALPAWAHGAPPPRVVALSEAKAIADKQGMSESRESELHYFPDTDTLEWLFTKETGKQGPLLFGKTLHIPVQNPAGIHWSKWEAIE